MSDIETNEIEEKWERLLVTTHFEHEDIIRFLQNNPDPLGVPFLRAAIELKPNLKYLDYDDYGAYYKKCLWALYAIGTNESLEVIQECSQSEIPELRSEANYRLSKLKLPQPE